MAKLFKTRFLTFFGGQFEQEYTGQFAQESTGHFRRIKVVNFEGFYILNKNGINTPLRLQHFFAQLAHESGNFARLKEGGSDAYFQKYEGRKNLGNTQKGDGLRFKGRGFIQITGRYNYTILSKETGIDYVNNPEWLEREADAMTSAIWFWNRNNLNKYADLDKIDSISDLINKGKLTEQYGDANGFTDRSNKLKYYKTVFK